MFFFLLVFFKSVVSNNRVFLFRVGHIIKSLKLFFALHVKLLHRFPVKRIDIIFDKRSAEKFRVETVLFVRKSIG